MISKQSPQITRDKSFPFAKPSQPSLFLPFPSPGPLTRCIFGSETTSFILDYILDYIIHSLSALIKGLSKTSITNTLSYSLVTKSHNTLDLDNLSNGWVNTEILNDKKQKKGHKVSPMEIEMPESFQNKVSPTSLELKLISILSWHK